MSEPAFPLRLLPPYLKTQPTTAPVLAVPELGNAAPAYGLSCFGDTWLDAQAVARDLRRQWRVRR